MTGQPDRIRPVRVGIAGLGFGLDVHLPGFRGIPGVEVVGLLGRDSTRGAQVGELVGVPVATDRETWFDLSFDAVSLALPPCELPQVAAAAIDRGLPILAEKPLGPDHRVARILAERASGRPNAVDFEFADLETFAALHRALNDGVIGEVRHVAIVWLTESWAHRGGGWSWKTDAARCGGVLSLFGSHVFYLLEWLLGPVHRLSARLDSRATARLRASPDAQPADDLAHLMMEHDGGAVSSAVVGNANPGVATHRWTIVGERGTAILDNSTHDYMAGFTLTITAPDGKTIQQITEPQSDCDGRLSPFRRLATRFIEAVRSGGRCRPDFADAARVSGLVDATRRAAQARSWIDVEAGR